MTKSYLGKHINFLKTNSSQNSKQFRNFPVLKQERILDTLELINNYEPFPDIIETFRVFNKITQKLFSRIQVKHFGEISNISKSNWIKTIKSYDQCRRIFTVNYKILKNFVFFILESFALDTRDIDLYGNIKTKKSIKEKVKLFCNNENHGLVSPELWDVIRFRISVANIQQLLSISTKFWEIFFEKIIRCRNFYYSPKRRGFDPYRAIHFVIYDDKFNFIEIQIMTRVRETVCFIDHPFIRGELDFFNQGHKDWLNRLSIKANIFELAESIVNFTNERKVRHFENIFNIENLSILLNGLNKNVE